MVNATPRPLQPREGTGTHCVGGWWAPGSVWTGRKISLPPAFDPSTVQPAAQSLNRLSYPGRRRKHCTQIFFQLIPQCIAFDVARCLGHESRPSSGRYTTRGHMQRVMQLVSRKWWIMLVVGEEAKMKTKTFYLQELSPFCCRFSFLTNEPRLLNYFLSIGTNRTPRAERRGSRIEGGLLYFNSRFVVTMCTKLSLRTYS